jgi:hypothetical protein
MAKSDKSKGKSTSMIKEQKRTEDSLAIATKDRRERRKLTKSYETMEVLVLNRRNLFILSNLKKKNLFKKKKEDKGTYYLWDI